MFKPFKFTYPDEAMLILGAAGADDVGIFLVDPTLQESVSVAQLHRVGFVDEVRNRASAPLLITITEHGRAALVGAMTAMAALEVSNG